MTRVLIASNEEWKNTSALHIVLQWPKMERHHICKLLK